MSKFSVYDTTSGKVLWVGEAPDAEISKQAVPGVHGAIAQSYDSETVYIDLADPQNPLPLPRPSLATPPDKTTALADGVDLVSFTGLPNPTDYEITGPAAATGTTTTGALQFTFDFPGDYTVTIKAFPYLDQVFTVTAT